MDDNKLFWIRLVLVHLAWRIPVDLRRDCRCYGNSEHCLLVWCTLVSVHYHTCCATNSSHHGLNCSREWSKSELRAFALVGKYSQVKLWVYYCASIDPLDWVNQQMWKNVQTLYHCVPETTILMKQVPSTCHFWLQSIYYSPNVTLHIGNF